MARDPMIIHLRNSTPEEPERPRRRSAKGAYVGLFLLIIVLGGIGYGTYYFFFSNSAESRIAQEEEAIIARVGELMLLPEGERPTIATVTDLNPLSGQLFFKNAHIGDIVLMYPQAQRAILYDPRAHKVVEVAPISLEAE